MIIINAKFPVQTDINDCSTLLCYTYSDSPLAHTLMLQSSVRLINMITFVSNSTSRCFMASGTKHIPIVYKHYKFTFVALCC